MTLSCHITSHDAITALDTLLLVAGALTSSQQPTASLHSVQPITTQASEVYVELPYKAMALKQKKTQPNEGCDPRHATARAGKGPNTTCYTHASFPQPQLRKHADTWNCKCPTANSVPSMARAVIFFFTLIRQYLVKTLTPKANKKVYAYTF